MTEGKLLTYPMVLKKPSLDNRVLSFFVEDGLDLKTVVELRGKLFFPPGWRDMVRHLKEFDGPDAPLPRLLTPHFQWACLEMERRHRSDFKLGVPISPIGELEGTSTDTFPGILARYHGYRKKADAFDSAWARCYKAMLRIYEGDSIEAKPVAMFGRGKVVSSGEGDTAGGLPARRGRLVMAPEIDDHILMSTFSKPCSRVVEQAWQSGIIMYGMSPFNRGGTIFLNNLVADLCPQLARRVSWRDEPSIERIQEMDRSISRFVREKENNFIYMKIDFSRYDSKIGRDVGHAALQSMMRMYDTQTKSNRRKLGRMFKYIEDTIIDTKICLPDGQVWRKRKGNVSGSPFTTLYNSWTDGLYVLSAIHFLLEGRVDPRITLRVHGDDNILIVPKEYASILTLPNLITVLEDGMHLVVNKDESSVHSKLVHRHGMQEGEAITFLGRAYMEQGGCWRSLYTTLEHAVHPDSDDFTPNGALSRCNGLLIDNPFNERAAYWMERAMDRLEEMGGTLSAPSLTEVRKYVHGFGMKIEAFERFQRISRLKARDMYQFTETTRSLLPTYEEGPIDFLARLGGQFSHQSVNWVDSEKRESAVDDLQLPTRRLGRSSHNTQAMTKLRQIEQFQRLRNFVRPGRRARKGIQGMGLGWTSVHGV